MRNIIGVILIIQFILASLGYNRTYAADKQTKVFEKKKIIIYELTPNQDKNNFKALYFVDASENDFLKMILNPENHVHWVPNIKSAKNIVEPNDSTIYTRVVISVKSFFKKEAIVKTTVTHHKESGVTYILQKIDDSIDYDSQYERLNDFEALWKVRAISNNKLEVELSFIGVKADYPDFVENLLKSIFIKKLYKLAYKSRSQATEYKKQGDY